MIIAPLMRQDPKQACALIDKVAKDYGFQR